MAIRFEKNPIIWPVTPSELRKLALSFPGAFESSHMGHADFRGPRGIFMTLARDESKVVFRLPPYLADSMSDNSGDGELVSKFGGANWLRFDLGVIPYGKASDLAEIAWRFRHPPAR